MSEYIDVVEHNPIVFVKKVCAAIAVGYEVQNTIPGYPSFSPYCQVRLFKSESQAVVVPDAWGDDITIAEYDPVSFMLLINTAIKGGWLFVESGEHFFDEKGLKSIQLTRKSVEKSVEKPAEKVETKPEVKPKANSSKPGRQAKAPKKALVAEPTITEMETTNDQQAE